MALPSLITEQSTVPRFPTILYFLGDHFGVDKKKSGDHFGVDLGIISGLEIISGSGSFRGLYRSRSPGFEDYSISGNLLSHTFSNFAFKFLPRF